MGETLIYARVSTADQDLDPQEDNLWEYCTQRLGIPEAEVDVERDKASGTTTDRSGYRTVMERVREDDIDRVVVRAIDRIGRDIRDIHDTIYEIVDDHDVGFHAVDDGLAQEPGDDMDIGFQATLFGLSLAAEVKAKKVRQNTLEGLRAAEAAGKWVGRPPYGFETDDEGFLQPTDDFSRARRAILAVEEEEWSQRKAARRTGVPRRTIPALLNRRDLYMDEFDNVSETGEASDTGESV
jgi:DNA invertase Pin-like site-specific DNA recombinase